eukprot:5447775-Lingulodinium_polyedra.AAC.1
MRHLLRGRARGRRGAASECLPNALAVLLHFLLRGLAIVPRGVLWLDGRAPLHGQRGDCEPAVRVEACRV